MERKSCEVGGRTNELLSVPPAAPLSVADDFTPLQKATCRADGSNWRCPKASKGGAGQQVADWRAPGTVCAVLACPSLEFVRKLLRRAVTQAEELQHHAARSGLASSTIRREGSSRCSVPCCLILNGLLLLAHSKHKCAGSLSWAFGGSLDHLSSNPVTACPALP